MMEGYFVRTLGMHRVYNSAFMNMLKNEENSKYRATIKNTLEFDPEILKRFVNFMNNPDEETAVAQFGKGDKYFGICTLLVTMPGLPMFGHGQIEGFEEKYGMEYRRAYRDEQPDAYMVDRHEREIFPLMKRRYLFSGSAMFRLYDMYCDNGSVNENVFAYSNRAWAGGGEEKTLIFYNNSYYETAGWIRMSDPAIPREGGKYRDSLSEALSIHPESHYFTLLREQKLNLWFIRSSKAICENGLFVRLKGYETQVFLDIYEVEDDAKGRWARLNNDLDGRGVPDPLAAIKDIFLGELYYSFKELFKPEIIGSLCNLSGKRSAGGLLNELAGEFIVTALNFVNGTDDWEPWSASETGTSGDEDDVSCKFTDVGMGVILEEFDEFTGRLAKINEALKNPATPLLAEIEKRIKNKNLLCAVALGYGLLSLLRLVIGKEANGRHAADLAFTHWDLGRKLREIFCRFGASEYEAWRIIDIARIVLSKTKIAPFWEEGKKFDAAEFSALILEENYLDEDFRRVLGINIFDDVIWFNKEGFEDTLFYSSLFFMVESSVEIPIDERIDRIAKIYEILIKAENKSGYRFDILLENLTAKPGKTAAKKTGVKTGTEAGAKKTTTKAGNKVSVKTNKDVKTGKSAGEKKVVKKPEVKTAGKPSKSGGVKADKKPSVKPGKTDKTDGKNAKAVKNAKADKTKKTGRDSGKKADKTAKVTGKAGNSSGKKADKKPSVKAGKKASVKSGNAAKAKPKDKKK